MTEPPRNSTTWRLCYMPSPYNRATDQTWTESTYNNFDHFHYDDKTFGGYEPYGLDLHGLTILPRQLLAIPCPFPNSSPVNHIRQHGQYCGPRTSRLLGQQGPDKEGGSNDPPTDPPFPDPTELRRQAAEEAGQKLQKIAELERQLKKAEMDHQDHATKWTLPLHNKGKELERGRPMAPPIPEWHKPLHERTNRYSVPRPPEKWKKPDLPPQPIGQYAEDAPHLGIKPMLLAPPKPFKGNHDNIECFLEDCMVYYKVFASFFQLCSQTVLFATSHFEGTAKDWWVYKRQEFWSNLDWDTNTPQY
ncbi:uncharacterized protein ARMOST_00575 [Armillaria ostoyae]|uniref:Uncharacterized protein n=1 Tax=Armillaria ostoyae TaxID=47428 RepID=A0A284QLI6_ARMOS|nr:uncharacterized protein ARMOST_00575 [Armillaria ostoyae]